MQDSSSTGIDFELAKRSETGEPVASAGIDAKQLLYCLLLVPAVVLALLPLGVYRPLDTLLPLSAIICAFLLSAIPRLWRIAQRRSSIIVGVLQIVSTWAGLALPFLGLLLFLNGALDRSPGNYVRAKVIQKTSPIGYREAQYNLRVSSWWPGRTFEDLNVGSREFARTIVGKRVIVEMHQGYLGMPWYAKIMPE